MKVFTLLRRHRAWPLLAAGAAMVSTCGAPRPDPWVKGELRDTLGIRPAGYGSRAILWRSSKSEIEIRNLSGFDRWRSKNKSKNLVMVSFPEGSLLERELRDDPHTLAFLPAPHTGHALVELSSEAERLGLAATAHRLGRGGCGQLEVVDLPLLAPSSGPTPAVYHEAVALPTVQALVGTVSDETLLADLKASVQALESQGTRYHASDSGQKTPELVQAQWSAAAAGKISGWKVATFSHQGSNQRSVIASIAGTDDPDRTAPAVIIGAHLDSINSSNRAGVAPGADDDASGIATLTAIIKSLAQSGARFRRTIELHAYAAEEVGLVGSHEIASTYASAGRNVGAMLQIDMNSWASEPQNRTIYLVATDTSATLRRAAKLLLTNYVSGDYGEKTLARGTSDHKSWTNFGYPAVFPFEDPDRYNESLHTPSDTSTTANNLPLAARFVRLGLAFLAHEAGLLTAQSEYEGALAALKNGLGKDLRLAITPSDQLGSYYLNVAAPSVIKAVELCKVTNGQSYGCIRELLQPTAVTGGNASRSYFALTAPAAIADDLHLVLFGYDQADHVVAARNVHLTKK